MPAMTKTALSDCSYPESMAYNIRDDIDATITRLKAVIDEEASLRNALRVLFDKRREEAAEQVRMANIHLHMVHQEEAAFCADVRHASAKIKEELGGSVTVGLLRANLAPQRPLSFEISSLPPVHVELGFKEDLHSKMSSPLHVDLSPRPDSMVDAVYDTSLRPPTILAPPRMPRQFPSIDSLAPARSPAQSTYGNEPPRSPAHSTNNFQPPGALAHSPNWLNPHISQAQPRYKLEPSTSPARSSHGIEPLRSPARSSRAFSPTMSPVRYACGIDPTRSHAQPTRGPNGNPLPHSPALSNRGPPCDTPAPSFEELVDGQYRIQTPLPQLPEEPVDVLTPNPEKIKKEKKGKGGGGDGPCTQQQAKDSQVPESKEEDAEPISPEAERVALHMIDEEPKKAAETKATEAKKKKAKSKKGIAKDTETKPTPNVIFPTDEAPPKLNAGSHPPSASIGFGAASLGNTSFRFGGPFATLNFGLRPPHSTFDSNVSSFGATTQTPAAVEDTPASMDDLFADMMQDADIEGGDTWGFGDSRNDLDAAFDESRGKSPQPLANDYLGEQLDSGYQHDDVGVYGDGVNGQNEGLDRDFGIVDGQDQAPTPLAKAPSPAPESPEEPPVAVVAPKKKKKGKKLTKALPMDVLAPKQPTVNVNAEEQAVMEEIKLSEEERLEAELRQLMAEEAEFAELERLEVARLLAEAAENERIDLQEEEERQRIVAEEEREHLHYMSLKEAAAVAEERLSTVQTELDALEAQKVVIIQQVESAREQEASCRYHKIMLSR